MFVINVESAPRAASRQPLEHVQARRTLELDVASRDLSVFAIRIVREQQAVEF